MNPFIRWARMPALVAICYVILLTAVLLGMTTSGAGFLPRFAAPAELGLGSNRVGIVPLTDRFIDKVLGRGADSSYPKPDPFGLRGRDRLERDRFERDRFGGVDDAPGEAVEHPFTNNDRANAYHVTRLPFTAHTSTADADREPGEPECGTQLGGTVWYRYTATSDEALLADTFGTGYQTSLAAYRQGSSGPAPLKNACDFDPQGNSQIKLDVTSGATYLFQIGAAVRGGALTFNLKRFGETILASVSTGDDPANSSSIEPSVSFDGRYIAFTSQATNLVPMNLFCAGCYNVFLRDRQAGTTSLVSVGLDGKAANSGSQYPQVSDDGRYVAFHSGASNLVPGDSNNLWDTFVRDMRNGRTERVSLNSRGEQDRTTFPTSLLDLAGQGSLLNLAGAYSTIPNGSLFSSMSADGRYVAFWTRSPMVEGDNDEAIDVFVRDRRNGTTRLVSLDNNGKDPPLAVLLDSISRNGRWIVLVTSHPMSERDGDLSQDVFVRDLWTGTTELVSVPEAGHELEGIRDAVNPGHTSQRSISDDGRFVVFGSDGALVDGDTNNVVDVFVRDRLRQTTERVSVSSSGEEGVGTTVNPPSNSGDDRSLVWAISGDGRKVAFTTDLNGLEPSDRNNGNDVFVHDRARGVTLRVSASGDEAGGLAPRISGDGMHIAFFGSYPLSERDTNTFEDVFVFSPLPAHDLFASDLRCALGRGAVCAGSGESATAAHPDPTAPCGASSEYRHVGLAGAREDFTPPLIPASPYDALRRAPDYEGWYEYQEESVSRFRYRIDVSGSSKKPFARTANVRVALRWDNDTDFDLYIHNGKGELLTYSYNNNFVSGSGESAFLLRLPHCTDLRVDVVNYYGLPPTAMTLESTLRKLE